MANRQELLKLNQEIELLESVGLIKAASVLHKKFIKESQAAPQTGAQSYMTNAGIEVIKPVQTPPPAQTPPPVQTVQPSLPPNYNAYDNYYQDPRTGRTVWKRYSSWTSWKSNYGNEYKSSSHTNTYSSTSTSTWQYTTNFRSGHTFLQGQI
jgi:hypothetical protein